MPAARQDAKAPPGIKGELPTMSPSSGSHESAKEPSAEKPQADTTLTRVPAAASLTRAVRSAGGLCVLYGLWVAASAVVALNSGIQWTGPQWFSGKLNVSIKDDPRAGGSEGNQQVLYAALGVGVALTVVGGLIVLRRRWAVYLGFLVTLASALIIFAIKLPFMPSRQLGFGEFFPYFLWLGVDTAVVPLILCVCFTWALVYYRSARIEAEYQELLGNGSGGGDEKIVKLVRLLRHPKKSIRVETIRELSGMGPSAAPAVAELMTSLLKATPPALSEKGVCMFCAQRLSIWTRNRLKTEQHPKGLPACMGCRNRLVNGQPSEAHLVAEALGAIGPAASEAAPALRKVSLSYDPLLAAACQAAIRRITRGADNQV